MNPLHKYRQLMVKLFESRCQHGAATVEDAILDAMDVVWHRMSVEERQAADALSCSIAAGELSEEQFIAMCKSENDTPYARG